MAPKTILYLIIFYLWVLNTSGIVCNGNCGPCTGLTNGTDCVLDCTSSRSCRYDILTCTDNHDCVVYCDNLESCQETTINAGTATSLILICGEHSYTGDGSCSNLTVFAQSVTNVNVQCLGIDGNAWSCDYMNLYCGTGVCQILCTSDKNCGQGTFNIDATLASQYICNDTAGTGCGVIDLMTSGPTNIPTTSEPTTAIPSTLHPTTINPTTTIPTSIPTTVHPTSINPSIYILSSNCSDEHSTQKVKLKVSFMYYKTNQTTSPITLQNILSDISDEFVSRIMTNISDKCSLSDYTKTISIADDSNDAIIFVSLCLNCTELISEDIFSQLDTEFNIVFQEGTNILTVIQNTTQITSDVIDYYASTTSFNMISIDTTYNIKGNADDSDLFWSVMWSILGVIVICILFICISCFYKIRKSKQKQNEQLTSDGVQKPYHGNESKMNQEIKLTKVTHSKVALIPKDNDQTLGSNNNVSSVSNVKDDEFIVEGDDVVTNDGATDGQNENEFIVGGQMFNQPGSIDHDPVIDGDDDIVTTSGNIADKETIVDHINSDDDVMINDINTIQ